MVKRIGIDYDGVIVDSNEIKSRWIQTPLGIYLLPWMTDKTSLVPKVMSIEKYNEMGDDVYEEALSLSAPLVLVK